MDRYLPFRSPDSTPITVEIVTGQRSVELHKHRFYEFVLITRGSCVHRYGDEEVVLIPGDVFLLPARHTHGYLVDEEIEIYNLQFFPERLGARWHNRGPAGLPLEEQWDSLLHSISLGRKDRYDWREEYRADINSQGIIHLDMRQREAVERMLKEIAKEQRTKNVGVEYVKHAYLEIILVILRRAQLAQSPAPHDATPRKRAMIGQVLRKVEAHLTDPIDVADLAADVCMSPNYFRTVFKEVTGLSPNNYLNRLRITRSLDYLREGALTIAEVAEAVGILDPNYFSRLFKKIVGHPPRESIGKIHKRNV